MSSFTYLLLFPHSESPTPPCPFPISSEPFHYLSFFLLYPSNLSCPLISRFPLFLALVARAQSVLNCHYPLFQPSFPYSPSPFTIHYTLFITTSPDSLSLGVLISDSPLLVFSLPLSEILCLGFPSPRMSCPMSSSFFPSSLLTRRRLRLLYCSTILPMTQPTPHHQPYLVFQSGATCCCKLD